jgi:hypothetical protein
MAVTAVYSTLGLVLASQLASARSIPPIVQPPYPSSGIPRKGFGQITDLVAFGDSYTDEGRRSFPCLCVDDTCSEYITHEQKTDSLTVGYLFANNWKLPPLGWRPPEVCEY